MRKFLEIPNIEHKHRVFICKVTYLMKIKINLKIKISIKNKKKFLNHELSIKLANYKFIEKKHL